ncbi:hypothetical protein [Olivibacter jilunii]|uniref:hypothetical protein n=1 Tax=Olivibacter jilunii TaxID=985016 RepID=UPI00102FBCB3|nr:hypothetical protein [Olivibacter jilunii]
MQNFSIKTILHVLLFALFTLPCYAQREFIRNINGHSRNYLLNASRTTEFPVNLPLIIVLHENGSSTEIIYRSIKTHLSDINAAIVFPQAFKKNWGSDSASLKNDQDFIHAIINDMYLNFRINRNKVYLLTSTEDKHTGDRIKTALNTQIASVRNSSLSDTLLLIKDLKGLANNYITTSSVFTIARDPEMERLADSANNILLKKRLVISFQPGLFFMFGSAKSGSEDKSYMDMSGTNSYLGINVTSWVSDKVGCFIDLSFLKGPQKIDLAGESLRVEGGGIVPATLGVKYNFLKKNKITTYALLGVGAVYISAKWGRIKDPSNINLNTKGRTAPLLQSGVGFNIRPSKRLLFGTQLAYFHSTNFESVGNITSVRGLNAIASIGYVIGANK